MKGYGTVLLAKQQLAPERSLRGWQTQSKVFMIVHWEHLIPEHHLLVSQDLWHHSVHDHLGYIVLRLEW